MYLSYPNTRKKSNDHRINDRVFFNSRQKNMYNEFFCHVGRLWPDKSTTSYAMLDFESDIENLQGKFLLFERNILQMQDIFRQYLKLI